MNSESSELDSEFSVIEELSAYLDGELGQLESQKVELRLGSDSEYLAEMQSLQRTWDMLDELPLAEPRESFTKTTMEMVVSEAVKDVRKGRRRSWVGLARVATILVSVGLLFWLSFAWIRSSQTESDRFLIENLSAIENYERFSVVENDIEFLEQVGMFFEHSLLDDSNVIGTDDDVLPSDPSWTIPESTVSRQSYVESLDVEQKTKLQRKLDDFLELTSDQQSLYVGFDRQLSAHQSGDQLMGVMRAYYNWLRSLDEGERSRLLDLDQQQRISTIEDIREKQIRDAFGRSGATQLPSKEDAEVVFDWFRFSIKDKERRIRARYARAMLRYARENSRRARPEGELKWFAENGPLNQLVNDLVRVDQEFIEGLVFKDLESLSLLLTREARVILEEQTDDEQRELVLQWVDIASQSRNDVSHETLRRYARRLPIEQQDRLDKLSTENYFNELNLMYRESQQRRFQRKDDQEETWESFFDFQD